MALKRGEQIKVQTGTSYANILFKQFQEFHKLNIYPPDSNIEKELLDDKLYNLLNPVERKKLDCHVFTPSSVNKCKRELFLKFRNFPKDDQTRIPYQTRWTRNASLVHEGVQKDMLYMEHYLNKPRLVVHRTEQDKPAWEENVKTTVQVEHNGVQIAFSGMMDGILKDTRKDKLIGFEFKTKSNSIAQVGNYKMKDAGESHKIQCIAYSIMFGLEDFIIMYESVAKDGWMKGTEARLDIRTFDFHVTQEMRNELLDELVELSCMINNDKLPPVETNKCLFCQYKGMCNKIEQQGNPVKTKGV